MSGISMCVHLALGEATHLFCHSLRLSSLASTALDIFLKTYILSLANRSIGIMPATTRAASSETVLYAQHTLSAVNR